nr:MucR family transcriptional regulator [uncultured Desulfobulbus sp.]
MAEVLAIGGTDVPIRLCGKLAGPRWSTVEVLQTGKSQPLERNFRGKREPTAKDDGPFPVPSHYLHLKEDTFMTKTLVQMTAEIIQSQITSKQMSTDEIKAALNETFRTLQSLQNSETISTAETDGDGAVEAPALDPKKSIQKNKVVCLECGQEFKMLSPKHLRSHGLTSKEYRKKYGFSARQPLCAKALSEKRSQSGKERGIPENLRIAIEARKKKTV